MQEDKIARVDALFGQRVRQVRKSQGLTQKQLAERLAKRGLNLDPTAITRLEAGSRPVRLGETILFADALAVDARDLIDSLQPPEEVIQELRDVANQRMGSARSAVRSMVGAFAAIHQLFRDQPDAIPGTHPDSYLEWVRDRMTDLRRSERPGWAPILCEDEWTRAGLQALADAVVGEIVDVPDDQRPRLDLSDLASEEGSSRGEHQAT